MQKCEPSVWHVSCLSAFAICNHLLTCAFSFYFKFVAHLGLNCTVYPLCYLSLPQYCQLLHHSVPVLHGEMLKGIKYCKAMMTHLVAVQIAPNKFFLQKDNTESVPAEFSVQATRGVIMLKHLQKLI